MKITDSSLIKFAENPLVIKYIPLSQAVLWDRNPHEGDVGQMIQSIQLHGFRDPPEFDVSLNGFPSGNHRTIALRAMEKSDSYNAPKHIGIDAKTGEWCMPVVFGADAGSVEAAEAYGIDANNLVMAGGGFEPKDIARLWKQDKYQDMLVNLANRKIETASVDGDHLDALINLSTMIGSKKAKGDSDGTQNQLSLKTPAIDDIDGLQKNYGVIEGQTWQVGKNRITTRSFDDMLRSLVDDTGLTIIVSPIDAAKLLHYWELTTMLHAELIGEE